MKLRNSVILWRWLLLCWLLRRKPDPRTDASLKMFAPLPETIPAKMSGPAEARVALGRMLFYDPRLSRSQTISCNSCHDLAKYGVDGAPTSEGFKRAARRPQFADRLQRRGALRPVLGRPRAGCRGSGQGAGIESGGDGDGVGAGRGRGIGIDSGVRGGIPAGLPGRQAAASPTRTCRWRSGLSSEAS